MPLPERYRPLPSKPLVCDSGKGAGTAPPAVLHGAAPEATSVTPCQEPWWRERTSKASPGAPEGMFGALDEALEDVYPLAPEPRG